VLDREQLCPQRQGHGLSDSGLPGDHDSTASQCRVSFEVDVGTSTTTSQAVEVDVEVLDLNDHSPVFPASQVTAVLTEASSPEMFTASLRRSGLGRVENF